MFVRIVSYLYEGVKMNEKKKAALAAGTGAAVGAGTSATIGGMGLTAAGTAVGIGAAPVVAAGAVVGLAGYGLYKAFGGGSNKKKFKK